MSTKQPVSFYQVARGVTPAAGAELVLAAPGHGTWRVVSLAFQLVTSAVVANRRVRLVADDGTDVWWVAQTTVDIAATATVLFGAYPAASAGGVATTAVNVPFPDGGLILQPGHRLRSLTAAIDVGDQYSAIRAQVQEFPMGPDVEWLPTYGAQLAEIG